MYNNDYVEEQDEKESGNFITNFYYNNKILVWVFIGIIVFILLMTILTKGGSNSKTETPKDYKVVIVPEDKEIYVNIGKSVKLTASVEDVADAKIEWSSDDELIAKINSNGVVDGIDYGTTKVYATYIDKNNGKHTEPRDVIVGDGDKNIELTDVSFVDGDLFMSLNSTYQISTILTPSRGYVESEKFASSNSSVVTVDNKGLVSAVGEGETTITMNVNNKFKKELRVFVDRDYTRTEIIRTPDSISFDGELRKMKVGTIETLTFTVEPKDTDVDKLIWESDNENVLTVDDGKIKAISEGRAVVTVSGLNGVKAKIDVEVEKDIVEVSDISLSTTELYLNVGDTQTIRPVISPDNASNKALSYASLSPATAYVIPNETGTEATITGLSAGTTSIIIKSNNNIEKRINVTVSSITPTSSSGGNGGSNGGGSGSSVGFKISSYDATGEGFINDTYEKTEPAGNGATAPLTVTVQKKSSSVDHLKILVCKYPATSSCGSLGTYTTSGTQTFTLTAAYAYVIRIEEYNSSGTKTRTTDRYAWIKNGSSGGSSTLCSGYTIYECNSHSSECKWDYNASKCISRTSPTATPARTSTPTPRATGNSPICSQPCCIDGVTVRDTSACSQSMTAGRRTCGVCATPSPNGSVTCGSYNETQCNGHSSECKWDRNANKCISRTSPTATPKSTPKSTPTAASSISTSEIGISFPNGSTFSYNSKTYTEMKITSTNKSDIYFCVGLSSSRAKTPTGAIKVTVGGWNRYAQESGTCNKYSNSTYGTVYVPSSTKICVSIERNNQRSVDKCVTSARGTTPATAEPAALSECCYLKNGKYQYTTNSSICAQYNGFKSTPTNCELLNDSNT